MQTVNIDVRLNQHNMLITKVVIKKAFSLLTYITQDASFKTFKPSKEILNYQVL